MELYWLGAYVLGGIIFMCSMPKNTFGLITLVDLVLTMALWPVWAAVLMWGKYNKL